MSFQEQTLRMSLKREVYGGAFDPKSKESCAFPKKLMLRELRPVWWNLAESKPLRFAGPTNETASAGGK
jgi:hypothetical protein